MFRTLIFPVCLFVMPFTALATGDGQPPGPAAELERAIQRHLAEGSIPNDLVISSVCGADMPPFQAEVFSSGVGIWNGAGQFAVSRDSMLRMLAAFDETGFAGLEPAYGGRSPDATAEDALKAIRDSYGDAPKSEPADSDDGGDRPLAIIVTCRVSLQLDGLRKEVTQRAKGEQSAELRRLAAAIHEECREPASRALHARDIADGLEKLAAGDLVPETFSLLIRQRSTELSDGSSWMLRLKGRAATMSADAGGDSARESRSVQLSREAFESLVRSLARNDVGGLPGNLNADGYVDLVVQVLDQRLGVQARPFDQAPPAPEARLEQLEAVVADLKALADS